MIAVEGQRVDYRQLEELKYRAFISYNRTDRSWAKTLHDRLERYVLPQALRTIKPGLKRAPRPLKPIFRDESEMVPGQDLPKRIRDGLRQSEFLIVICSPNAARSGWVEKEICDFAAFGGTENILTVIVAGEPNAAARGLDPALECLPKALRYELELTDDSSGDASASISDRPTEPLWVDWRVNPAREQDAFLRLVAALLSLSSFDELVSRDRAHRRRQVMLRWTSFAVGVLAIAVIGGAVAVQYHNNAIRNSYTLVRLANQATADGDYERSARYALLAMKGARLPLVGFEPSAAEDALVRALQHNRRLGAPIPVRRETGDVAALSPDGTLLGTVTKSGVFRAWDMVANRAVGKAFFVGHDPISLTFSHDNALIAVFRRQEPNNALQVWNIHRRNPLHVPLSAGWHADLTQFSFSFDDSMLAAIKHCCDGGSGAVIWDLKTGFEREADGAPIGLSSIAFSHDGRLLAIGEYDSVILYDTRTKTLRPDRIGVEWKGVKRIVAFAPDDTALLVGSDNGAILFWSFARSEDTDYTILSGGAITDIAFSRDDNRAGALSSSGVMHIWRDYRYFSEYDSIGPGGQLAFLPDGWRIATLSQTEARLWRLSNNDRSGVDSDSLGETVCNQLLPGTLSRLTPAELAAAPILDMASNGDACGRQ